MQTWLVVGLGGFLGSVCRYGLSLLPLSAKVGFPVITLLINGLGCFGIGVAVGAASRAWGADSAGVLFLRVGFMGGFTTFSTFALELNALLEGGRLAAGAAYVLLSVTLGLAALLAGKAILP